MVKKCSNKDLVTFTVDDVKDSVKHLKNVKSCGTDRIQAEHLKCADDRVYVLLTLLFSMCISHSFIREGIMYTIIIPVVKDKKGDLLSYCHNISFFLRCLNW